MFSCIIGNWIGQIAAWDVCFWTYGITDDAKGAIMKIIENWCD